MYKMCVELPSVTVELTLGIHTSLPSQDHDTNTTDKSIAVNFFITVMAFVRWP